ncbi:MAG: BON domain-containing protein, partial [Candidatus Rokuibacteriota bacterium]
AALALAEVSATEAIPARTPADRRITETLRGTLGGKAATLHIDTRQGTVYIVGVAGNAAERREIAAAAREVPGVDRVVSNIRIGRFVPTLD